MAKTDNSVIMEYYMKRNNRLYFRSVDKKEKISFDLIDNMGVLNQVAVFLYDLSLKYRDKVVLQIGYN